MNTTKIYNLANQMSDEQLELILNDWNSELNYLDTKKEAKEKIRLYNWLVETGDSKKLACATVFLKKPISKEVLESYRFAYEN